MGSRRTCISEVTSETAMQLAKGVMILCSLNWPEAVSTKRYLKPVKLFLVRLSPRIDVQWIRIKKLF